MLASRFASRSPVLRSDSPLPDDQIYRVAPPIFAEAPTKAAPSVTPISPPPQC